MRLFARLRARAGRRALIVVGVFVLVALAAGASAVLAGSKPTGLHAGGDVPVPRAALVPRSGRYSPSIVVGRSVKNDVSRPLSKMPAKPIRPRAEHEASPNPRPVSRHRNLPDGARQTKQFAPNMPSATLNFDGIPFPGVSCNCAPPDTNGEAGATQYVQIVNTGFQVYDKTTGNALLANPVDINTIWTGFGGVCEAPSFGDPVVLYDQLANRWLISQFAGVDVATDECIAVSTGVDATGNWNRYDFHLGTDFFDYPKLGVWPDAYYMSMNVFNAAGDTFLGPQPFAFDRAAMLAGNPATFVTTRDSSVFSPSNDGMLPADLDGSTPPPAGAPEPFLMSGTAATWKLWRFHVDFASPSSSTFTLGGNLSPLAYGVLCPNVRDCVPQGDSTDGLDAVADRAMFRLAYRNFGGGSESLVGNQTVSSSGVAGIRWFEINHATTGAPAFTQESTYQPDTTWRWLGSAAMDRAGDLAIGYSASDATTNPQIRYAGRLSTDTPNTLAQGEATLFPGTGSQDGTGNRWGDYSDMTVDPVDDCTFWYTNEYYAATGTFNWRTRIGNFKFPGCTAPAGASLSILKTADAAKVKSGDPIGFNVTLINSGASAATGLTVTDNLPGGTGVDWTLDPSSDAGWSIAGSPPNESLTYTPTSLAGTTATHVHVTSTTAMNTCGTFGNTASFTSTNGGNDSANASVDVSCLDVTKTADAAGVTAGQQIGYTVAVANNAPSDATGVAITDHLPAGNGINWSIDAANSSAGWSISGVAPNQSLVAPATIPHNSATHVHVVSGTTTNSGGTYNNTASVTSSVGDDAASASTGVSTCSLGEGFNSVGSLSGWFVQNNSDPVGPLDWFQGDPGAFPAQSGASNSYVAADFDAVDVNGTISDWLLTPVLTLKNGTQLTFWTRKFFEPGPDFFPDRLQVRLSTNGASTNVGTSATDVGDFTRVLLDINPQYTDTGYPFVWTKYTVTLSGISGTVSGRAGFRYFVENGGFFGTRSDYIGIDTAGYTCTPPPPPPPPPAPPPPPPPPHSLAVTKNGTGFGRVTSSPPGIDCGATCVATFLGGTSVTLTATPAAGSRFAGWSADCTGTSCHLTMSTDHFAVATFNKVPRCIVPKVVGLTLKKAKARIKRAHCRVGKVTLKRSTRRKKGRVLSQKPKPGKRLAAGARVTLVVGKGGL